MSPDLGYNNYTSALRRDTTRQWYKEALKENYIKCSLYAAGTHKFSYSDPIVTFDLKSFYFGNPTKWRMRHFHCSNTFCSPYIHLIFSLHHSVINIVLIYSLSNRILTFGGQNWKACKKVWSPYKGNAVCTQLSAQSGTQTCSSSPSLVCIMMPNRAH